MKHIRIGKDIKILWPILTNKQEVALEGRDLNLILRLPTWEEKQINFISKSNIAVFTIGGIEQKMTGIYSLTLWENYGKEGQTAVDYCDAFCLVPTTCQEGSGDEGITTEVLNLESSNLELGVQGPPGPSGPQGEQGIRGEDGISPRIEVVNSDDKVFLQITDVEGIKQTPDLRGPSGRPGPTPVLTANSEGVIFVNGELLTDVVQIAAGKATSAADSVMQLPIVRTDMDQGLSAESQARGRDNLSAVGCLHVEARVDSANNYRLTPTTSVSELDALYGQFMTSPGRFRWILTISEDNTFVEQVEARAVKKAGGLELLFCTATPEYHYAFLLTVAGGSVTKANIEYRVLPRQSHLSLATVWDTRIHARFNSETGYWEMNGLTDITPSEMDKIAAYGLQPILPSGSFMCARIRTAFPMTSSGSQQYDASFIFVGSEVETLNMQIGATSYYHAFENCRTLRRIDGYINVLNCRDLVGIAINCLSLEYLPLQNIWTSIILSTLPRLTPECGIFLITKVHPRTGIDTITITLHAEVYDAWMADEGIQGALSEHPIVALASAGRATNVLLLADASPAEIALTEKDGVAVMQAPAGCYLTQHTADDTIRTYVTERMLLSGERIADWRVATALEKAEFEERIL